MSSNGAYEANEEIFRSRVLGELQAIKAALQAAESAPPAPNNAMVPCEAHGHIDGKYWKCPFNLSCGDKPCLLYAQHQ